jgi:hypothetical protein
MSLPVNRLRFSMNIHKDFFNHLNTLQDGDCLVEAYKQYKNADDGLTFELNGALKQKKELRSDLAKLHENLKRVICARNKLELELFRMTSDTEFPGPNSKLEVGKKLTYDAFMSTSKTPEALHQFAPSSEYGNPLVLKITCPPLTPMALLENDGGMEDEFLLGAGTEFEVLKEMMIEDKEEIVMYLGYANATKKLRLVTMQVTGHPTYINDFRLFEF